MDLITQGLLGASIGQAGYSKKLGKRAVLWGGILGLLPDLDVLADYIGGTFVGYKYHRWITHALWFDILLGLLFGLLMAKKDRKNRSAWMGLGIFALTTHPLLDLFTHYGTQLWAPFSDIRYGLNAVSVIDLRYTGPLILSLIGGAYFIKKNRVALVQSLGKTALLLTTGYLFYTWDMNLQAERYARATWPKKKPLERLTSYPTLFQPYHRHLVAHSGSSLCIASFDFRTPAPPHWRCKEQSPRLNELQKSWQGERFSWFSDGEVLAVDISPSHVEFHDMRFPYPYNPLTSLWGMEIKDKEIRPFRQRRKITWKDFKKAWNGKPVS